jgi:hypothetical protein
LEYCRNLLDDGGFCELNLPSTYRTWKIESGQQCGSPSYDKFTYTNPGSGVVKSLLSVDYSARQEYELSKTPIFRAFKAVVLFLWLIAMLVEAREITQILTWCIKFPDAEQFGEDAVIEEADPADPEDVRYRIQGIINSHRLSVAALICIRAVLSTVILYVGTTYLLKQTEYVDLLLNGVALIFIVEIANVLYGQVLREEIRDQCEDIFPMKAAMYGVDYLNRRPALVDIISVVILLIIVYYVMDCHHNSVVIPVHDALECTCLSSGSTCYEAQKFGFDFWHSYWKDTIPAIYSAVAALKSGTGGTVAFSAHGAAHAGPATTKYEKELHRFGPSLTVHPDFKVGEAELSAQDKKSLSPARLHAASLPEKRIHHHHKPHQSQISSWIHRHFSLSEISR